MIKIFLYVIIFTTKLAQSKKTELSSWLKPIIEEQIREGFIGTLKYHKIPDWWENPNSKATYSTKMIDAADIQDQDGPKTYSFCQLIAVSSSVTGASTF